MSRSTISTFQLFALFPDEETARVYLEDRLWPNGPVCPDCKSGERVSALGTCATRKAGYYRCLTCDFDFTIRTNTIFERSKVPLHKWLYSMYLLVTARKGISSLQLAKEIGVTQKTAWFILGRLREACGGPDGPLDKLRGIIEIQATHLRKVDSMIQTFESVSAWLEEGKRRFGDDFMKWKFVCPVCGNVASVLDFKGHGESADIATKECIGRYRKERAHPFGEGADKVTQPCDYAGYGLFRLSPVRVKHPDGHETHSFAFAEVPA